MIGYEVEVGENGIKEDFITWYLPFYNKINVVVPKYLADPITYSDLKYRYEDYLNVYLYKKFEMKNNNKLNPYYRFIFSNILGNTFIKNMNINYTKNHIDNLRLINKDKHNLTILSSPIIANTIGNRFELYQNINFIVSLSYMYLFFISTNEKGIVNIGDIQGKIINIGAPNTEEYFLGNIIINNLGYDNVKITNYDDDIAFSKLFSGEIDGLILNDFYPSPVLERYMLTDFTKMLQVIPWDGLNKELFETENPYVKRISIDLNSMPRNYLPQKIGNKEYTEYNPDFETYRYSLDMLCNKELEPKVSYQVAKSIFYNIESINNSDFLLKNPLNKIFFPDIAVNFYNIPVHIGAKLFYNEKTAYTQNSSIYCANYVGKEKCDDRKVMEAKILESSGMAMGGV